MGEDTISLLKKCFQHVQQLFLALHDVIGFMPDDGCIVMVAVQENGMPSGRSGTFYVIFNGIPNVPGFFPVQMKGIFHCPESAHIRFEVADCIGFFPSDGLSHRW